MEGKGGGRLCPLLHARIPAGAHVRGGGNSISTGIRHELKVGISFHDLDQVSKMWRSNQR